MTESLAAMDKLGAAACPSQLTAPVLHKVISDPAILKWVLGAKGVGSNGDGAVQFLCRTLGDAQSLCIELKRTYAMQGLLVTVAATADA